jgi:Uma2 family endonuclease
VNVTPETWPRPHRLTVDEYYRMAEVGLLAPDARVELIEGEIIDMAPIGSRHASAVDWLARRFIEAVGESAIVRVQGPIRLGPRSEPQPDLALLRRRADRYAGGHPASGDVLLVVEVSDATLDYDRNVKAGLYARHGIPALWIVDLPQRRLHTFGRPGEGGYRDRSVVDGPAVGIPGLSIDLDPAGLF